jgi:hypothetical protein
MVKYFKLIPSKKLQSPKDNLLYLLPPEVVSQTERILSEYGMRMPPHEGLVYWGGQKDGDRITISIIIAPKTTSSYGRVSTSPRSNFEVVRLLSKYNRVQIAQVHSHPGKWIDHSSGDDDLAAFKVAGLLSIVVPRYCHKGMIPLSGCGIHRYTNGEFIRLAPNYIKRHFIVENSVKMIFEDLRHDK